MSVTRTTQSGRETGVSGTAFAPVWLPTNGGNQGGTRMDDKIEGKWDQTKGKVKEEAGKLGGDKSTEIGGKVDQGKGKLKEGLGDVKEGLHDERVDR